LARLAKIAKKITPEGNRPPFFIEAFFFLCKRLILGRVKPDFNPPHFDPKIVIFHVFYDFA